MNLELEIKSFRKKLEHERERRTRDLAKINHVIDAFDRNGHQPDPRAGRKLSKAHRLAIKRGIAASKKERK